MGRPTIGIETLHGNTIEELVDRKNNTSSKFERMVLTIITMRVLGYTNTQINQMTHFTKATIVSHVKNWNKLGLKSLKDNRNNTVGPKLSPDIVDDLKDITLHKKPNEFGYKGHRWTGQLLSDYIYDNYCIRVSDNTIREILKANRMSYKKCEARPTKANKTEQEQF